MEMAGFPMLGQSLVKKQTHRRYPRLYSLKKTMRPMLQAQVCTMLQPLILKSSCLEMPYTKTKSIKKPQGTT